MIARHHVVALDANSNCESATWCFFWGGALHRGMSLKNLTFLMFKVALPKKL